jgi:thioredoxin reductase (NADPH)
MYDAATIVAEADVAIVGAGPIGLEMAVALKRAGLSVLQFDAGQIGQTISWYAPGTRFFSSTERIAIAGVPIPTAGQEKPTREEYLAYLRGIVVQFGLRVNTYESVEAIDRDDGGFLLGTRHRSGPRRYRARHVVLCTGGTDRPRKLGIPGEDLPHVSNYFKDPHTYFQQNLLVVGGKNSAVEAALRSHHIGARVSISYRRDSLPAKSIKYWLLPEAMGLIDAKRIGGYFGTVPIRITPTHVTLQRVNENLKPCGDTVEVPADFVLLLIGYEQDNTLLHRAGVTLTGDEQAPTFDPVTMQTNVPGLFVAGTATGGTQLRYTVFIENCHVHVERIVAAIQGAARAVAAPVFAAPES